MSKKSGAGGSGPPGRHKTRPYGVSNLESRMTYWTEELLHRVMCGHWHRHNTPFAGRCEAEGGKPFPDAAGQRLLERNLGSGPDDERAGSGHALVSLAFRFEHLSQGIKASHVCAKE